MSELREIWRKLDANERLAATGAIVVVGAWLAALIVAFGGGYAFVELLAALALLAAYYLEYAPNGSFQWPAPVPTIALAIAGIAALVALLGLVVSIGGYGMRGAMRAYGFEGYELGQDVLGRALVAIAMAVGAGMMALGTWREYQAAAKGPPL